MRVKPRVALDYTVAHQPNRHIYNNMGEKIGNTIRDAFRCHGSSRVILSICLQLQKDRFLFLADDRRALDKFTKL